jgi:phosphohistidine phosphatase
MPEPAAKRMELILWRHAESDEGEVDLSRRLSAKGLKQASWMAAWLQQRLPSKFTVVSSPAQSAQQTAAALGVAPRVSERVGPGATVFDVLEFVDWPNRRGSVTIVVGHQPTLGRVAAYLLTQTPADLSIRKGGLWWLARRDKDGKTNVLVRAVVSPDIL